MPDGVSSVPGLRAAEQGRGAADFPRTPPAGPASAPVLVALEKRDQAAFRAAMGQVATQVLPLAAAAPTASALYLYDLLRTVLEGHELLQFAAATATQKKEILKESLQIEIWDKYHEKAKEVVRRLSTQAASLDDRIKASGDVDRELSANKAAMDDLRTKIAAMEKQIKQNARQLEKARAKLSGESASDRLEAIVARAAAIKAWKQTIVPELENYKEMLEKGRSDRSSTEERLLEAARQVLVVSGHPGRKRAETLFRRFAPARKRPSYAAFCDKLEQDKASLRTQQKKVDDLVLKLQQLLALEPGKECPTCLETLGDPKKVAQRPCL